MSLMTFALKGVPAALRAGIDAVAADHKPRFGAGRAAVDLSFEPDTAMAPDRYTCRAEGDGIVVRYGSRSSAFRALGRLLAADRKDLPGLTLDEASSFSMRGLMIDCSRNGVMTPDAVRRFMRRVALMGVNMIMFYAEDTYEVPGEPFFGYLRGGFTQDEIRALDDVADALGIELIPCIQTLGHLEQVLQWDPYFGLRDTAGILLSNDEKTYEFIRKIIRAASAPVRSRRIHIGMDEAHGLGSGQYKAKFGDKPPFEIMNAHLTRVRDLCREEGLRPMIWSDMYFRLGSKTHGYYDTEWSIPDSIVAGIPKDVQLVYWDYYHPDVETYRTFIGLHRKLGSDPVMGGGIWTWSHMWCALPWSFTAVNACMQACRAEGLREVFMTMWGDDGMEVDIFSALPGIQYFCEHAFGADDPMEAARRHFAAVCGSPFDAWVRAADVDSIPHVAEPAMSHTNAGRSLLWQDPLFPLLDPLLAGKDLGPHYRKLAAQLARTSAKPGLSQRLAYPEQLARVLALKVNLRRDLAKAYRRGNKTKLRELAKGTLPALRKEVDRLWKAHRAMWMDTYKPFGWEVIECRYGGLRARLQTLAERLADYLAGRLEAIAELEAELHNPWPNSTRDVPSLSFGRAKTPSCIK